ncbi:MAG TPA: DUF1638 domain-containing protein [Steroidobacteraceae bacterium]|jgi:hypothetical protein|nr:DUF1638 domain-containing protein [Steroidobacteraceae bacterium]
MDSGRGVLVIACGALAREIAALRRVNGWTELDVCYLPPQLHNRPERIAAEVQAQIRAHRDRYQRIFVAYGDCGTGGGLDRMLREEGVERIPGAHCYEFFASPEVFTALAEAEPGTFYLTDFLVRHFDHLVTRSLGIDRHPELASMYFGNYRRVVYLAQAPNEGSLAKAQSIATRMGLEFKFQFTGYGGLASRLTGLVHPEQARAWRA